MSKIIFQNFATIPIYCICKRLHLLNWLTWIVSNAWNSNTKQAVKIIQTKHAHIYSVTILIYMDFCVRWQQLICLCVRHKHLCVMASLHSFMVVYSIHVGVPAVPDVHVHRSSKWFSSMLQFVVNSYSADAISLTLTWNFFCHGTFSLLRWACVN